MQVDSKRVEGIDWEGDTCFSPFEGSSTTRRRRIGECFERLGAYFDKHRRRVPATVIACRDNPGPVDPSGYIRMYA